MPARGKSKKKAKQGSSSGTAPKDERTCGQRMREHEYLSADSQVQVAAGSTTVKLQAGTIMCKIKNLLHWAPHASRPLNWQDVFEKAAKFAREKAWGEHAVLQCRVLSEAEKATLAKIVTLCVTASGHSDLEPEHVLLMSGNKLSALSRRDAILEEHKDGEGGMALRVREGAFLLAIIDGAHRLAALLLLALDPKHTWIDLDFEVPVKPYKADTPVPLCRAVGALTNDSSTKLGRASSFIDQLFYLMESKRILEEVRRGTPASARSKPLSRTQFVQELVDVGALPPPTAAVPAAVGRGKPTKARVHVYASEITWDYMRSLDECQEGLSQLEQLQSIPAGRLWEMLPADAKSDPGQQEDSESAPRALLAVGAFLQAPGSNACIPSRKNKVFKSGVRGMNPADFMSTLRRGWAQWVWQGGKLLSQSQWKELSPVACGRNEELAAEEEVRVKPIRLEVDEAHRDLEFCMELQKQALGLLEETKDGDTEAVAAEKDHYSVMLYLCLVPKSQVPDRRILLAKQIDKWHLRNPTAEASARAETIEGQVCALRQAYIQQAPYMWSKCFGQANLDALERKLVLAGLVKGRDFAEVDGEDQEQDTLDDEDDADQGGTDNENDTVCEDQGGDASRTGDSGTGNANASSDSSDDYQPETDVEAAPGAALGSPRRSSRLRSSQSAEPSNPVTPGKWRSPSKRQRRSRSRTPSKATTGKGTKRKAASTTGKGNGGNTARQTKKAATAKGGGLKPTPNKKTASKKAPSRLSESAAGQPDCTEMTDLPCTLSFNGTRLASCVPDFCKGMPATVVFAASGSKEVTDKFAQCKRAVDQARIVRLAGKDTTTHKFKSRRQPTFVCLTDFAGCHAFYGKDHDGLGSPVKPVTFTSVGQDTVYICARAPTQDAAARVGDAGALRGWGELLGGVHVAGDTVVEVDPDCAWSGGGNPDPTDSKSPTALAPYITLAELVVLRFTQPETTIWDFTVPTSDGPDGHPNLKRLAVLAAALVRGRFCQVYTPATEVWKGVEGVMDTLAKRLKEHSDAGLFAKTGVSAKVPCATWFPLEETQDEYLKNRPVGPFFSWQRVLTTLALAGAIEKAEGKGDGWADFWHRFHWDDKHRRKRDSGPFRERHENAEVKASDGAGRGLFALKSFEEGEPICFFLGEWVHSQMWPGARHFMMTKFGQPACERPRWFFGLESLKGWCDEMRLGMSYMTHEEQQANYINNSLGAKEKGDANVEFVLIQNHVMALKGLDTVSFSQEEHDAKLPLVGVYATRPIKEKEEFLADYGVGQAGLFQDGLSGVRACTLSAAKPAAYVPASGSEESDDDD